MSRTLIFDCDGVLADTEAEGHLTAFNTAFEEIGLDVRWDRPTYADLLHVGGGKERLRSLFSHAVEPPRWMPSTPAGREDLVRRLHARKTEIFIDLVNGGQLPARAGVKRIVKDALEAGWTLAVASTSSYSSVVSVLTSVVGSDHAAQFAGVFAGDTVRDKKPAPDIYNLAFKTLHCQHGSVLVIEDSAQGAQAAAAAELPHLITVSTFTHSESFPAAAAVVSSLGDEDEPGRVLSSAVEPAPHSPVTLDDLARAMTFTPAALAETS